MVARAWKRIVPTSEIARDALEEFLKSAQSVGFLRDAPDLSRQDKGWFEQRLGPGVTIHWFVYNAGPSAMEAIFANAIDLT